MNLTAAFLVLLLAAVLEAAGDALIRVGLHVSIPGARIGLFVAGAFVLGAYGVVVNTPPWDFGKLLGVYVTLFFLVAQVINLVFFGVRPDLPVLIGGVLIISSGMVITFWHQ